MKLSLLFLKILRRIKDGTPTIKEYRLSGVELMKTAPIQNTHYAHKTDEEKKQLKKDLQESGCGFDI